MKNPGLTLQRVLVALLMSLVAFWATKACGNHNQQDLTTIAWMVSTGVFAIGIFASRGVIAFANKYEKAPAGGRRQVPAQPSPAFLLNKQQRSATTTAVQQSDNRTPSRKAPAIQPAAVKKDPTSQPPVRSNSASASLKSVKQDDGMVRVELVVCGLTGREFDTLRNRASNISGIKWEHSKARTPEDRRDNRRNLQGVIKKGNEEALLKLQNLTDKVGK